MKTSKIIYISVLAFLCFSNFSCNEKKTIEETKYPIMLGEMYCAGKLIHKGEPTVSLDFPPVPCPILWLESEDLNYYIISYNSNGIGCGKMLVVDDTVYFGGDEVEIKGKVTVWQDVFLEEYYTLEIETIKKINEQKLYVGAIAPAWNPECSPPVLPSCSEEESKVFSLEFRLDFNFCSFALSINSKLFNTNNKLIIEDVEYFIYDEVEIQGNVKLWQDSNPSQYFILEIETIRKLP